MPASQNVVIWLNQHIYVLEFIGVLRRSLCSLHALAVLVRYEITNFNINTPRWCLLHKQQSCYWVRKKL